MIFFFYENYFSWVYLKRIGIYFIFAFLLKRKFDYILLINTSRKPLPLELESQLEPQNKNKFAEKRR